MGGTPLSIRGIVIDAEARPVPGVRVWAEGGEVVPFVASGTLATMEGYLNGGTSPRDWKAEHPGKSFSGVIDREPVSYWAWVETDSAGRFELGGLQEKDYRLGLFEPTRVQLAMSQTIPAGTAGATIVFTPKVHDRRSPGPPAGSGLRAR